MKLTKICEHCKKEFETRRQNSKYCSLICYQKDRANKYLKKSIRVCQTCKKEFILGGNKKQSFCSKICSATSENKKITQRRNRRKKSLIKIKCPVCKKIFETKNEKRKFCSQECGHINKKDPARYRPGSRKCPKCKSIINYKTEKKCNEAEAANRLCKICQINGDRNPGVPFGKGKKNPSYSRRGKSWEEIYGIVGAIKRRMNMFGENSSSKRPEVRRKIRLNLLKRKKQNIKNDGQLQPFYNPIGCKLFNEIMKKTKTFIQHAENGGEFYIVELGFWVDGYDQENNIVYEIDEKHHFNWDGTYIERDINRQKEIIAFLNCEFIRIKYINKIFILED